MHSGLPEHSPFFVFGEVAPTSSYSHVGDVHSKTWKVGRDLGPWQYGMPAVGVPNGLKDVVVVYIQHMKAGTGYVNTLGIVREKWGTETLRRWKEHSDITIEHKLLGAELSSSGT